MTIRFGSLAGRIAFAFVAAAALGGCSAKSEDIHDTQEARGQPCANCHRAAFAAATSPKHVGTFPETCGSCHSTTGWRPATLNDHPWFILDGKHASATCAGCHTGSPPQYAGTPTDCAGCHRKEFTATKNPPHVGLFGETCGDCHSKNAWLPATVTEHPWFQLDGKHASTPCMSCHIGNPRRFAGTPKYCVSCHRQEYTTTKNPPHVGVLPETCEGCHSKNAWLPATVTQHPWFQLDGKHVSTPCVSCHSGNPKRYVGTPQECVGCHLSDYQRATFPGHNNFPQTCKTCHNTMVW